MIRKKEKHNMSLLAEKLSTISLDKGKGTIYHKDMEFKERNKKIVELYNRRKESMSLEQIGKKFGITKQRVVQIIKNAKGKRS